MTAAPTEFAGARVGPATARITRSAALLVGAVGVLLGPAVAREAWQQARFLAWWWTPLAAAVVFGSCLALAVLAFVAPLRVVRGMCGGVAAAMLIAIVLLPLAVRHPELRDDPFWLLRTAAPGAAAGALVWRPRVAAVALVLVVAGSAAANGLLQGGVRALPLLLDFSRNFGIAGLLTWGLVTVLRAAATLDEESARAERDAAQVAAADAKSRERARFSAIIHDDVMSTLLDASRGRDAAALGRLARRTLGRFDEFRRIDERGDLDAVRAIGMLRATVSAVNPGIAFRSKRLTGFARLRVPADVGDTIAAALAEAVRNSLRHGGGVGRRVHREVTVTVGTGALRVEMRDDGAGFDTEEVPAHRLGVRRSILARMADLPGGAAFVESAPGQGTTVTLVWVHPSTGEREPDPGPETSGATAAERWDLRGLLGLRGRQGALVTAVLLATIASISVSNLRAFPDHRGAILVAYTVIGAAAVVTLAVDTEPFPRLLAAAVAAAGPLSTGIAYHHVDAARVHEFVWTVYATSVVLCFLAVRGRSGFAVAGIVATTLVAMFDIGLGTQGISMSMTPLIIVVTGILIAAIARSTLGALRRLADESASGAAARATLRAQGEERARQLERLDDRARPMLERIAAGDGLTDTERYESRLLEAELRDGLRAPALTTAALAAATRGARSRGVEVLLLDDGGLADAPDTAVAAVLTEVAQQLDKANAGAVTVRILPPARPVLATILIDAPTELRRIEIDHHGTTHTLIDPT
ncbi:sensor histidine kinase [Nocardia blacklockiae]|uniref:sensor histidine kinase n=1 Tax=Nocardia blacklockiae TaxID=480036 RepID=UPI001893EA2E|nr:ATP-binding protein [Nocardia blacklockiae]MBF6174944.1 ATP-binding protein [Nocardia blacklockiae]